MNSTTDRLSYLNPSEYSYTTTDETFNPRRNLNDIFNSEDVSLDTEHLRVYLRVRPSLPDENLHSEEFQVELLNKQNIVLTAPASSNTFKNTSHGIAKLSQKFTFSHIYDPTTTQKELFDESTLGLVNDFINGQNILLFTYGATNSGKTFTVQGSQTDPGLLPRTLDVLFRSIGDRHYPNSDLKPLYFCGIIRLEDKDIKKEEEKKQNILKTGLENMSRFSLSTSVLSKFSSDSFSDTMPSSTNTSAISSVIEVTSSTEDDAIEVLNSENTVYAVFVSFAEIYNEYIHDLLECVTPSKKHKRHPLMLGEDRNGSIYIKGLQEVRVTSAEEAWHLLEIGRQNLHFAATRLNHNSSRSHCIFTIKVVRLADIQNPHVARVSMMSICDLAGTERAGKTKSNHDRLKEAGNINTSLLVLSRCLDALRQNQMQKGAKKKEVPVPYRDSKLTRLFQSFFLGRGKASMIVNISRCPLMFDETLQVLKFSAIAKQVALTHAKEPDCQLAVAKRTSCQSQFSKFVRNSLNSSGRLSVPWVKDTSITFGESDTTRVEEASVIVEEDEDEEENERYEALLNVIANLRDKLIQENKEKNELEDRLRNELCNEFSQQIVEIENAWSQRLKEQEAKSEELSEWRINALTKSMKKTNSRKRFRPEDDPDDEYVSSILLFQEEQKVKEKTAYIEELEMERKHLMEELEAVKASQKKTSEQANRAQEENTKLNFQLAQLTRSNDEALKQLEEYRKRTLCNGSENQEIRNLQNELQNYQAELSQKEKEVVTLNKMLFEAAEEFIIKEEIISNLAKSTEKNEKDNRRQLMVINDLESQLLETRDMMSQHATQLEERDQHISDLRVQLAIVQNVEDVVGELKKLRNITESYQTQILILEQNLTTTEKERNKAEKELHEMSIKKRQIEEDFLRDKSKLLLDLANLKRNNNASGLNKTESSTELKEAVTKVAELQREVDTLKEENKHQNNEIIESKELFTHMQKANTQLESHQKVLLKEREDLCREMEELTKKLAENQEQQATQQADESTLKANNVNITNQVNTLKNKIKDNEELVSTMGERLLHQQTLCEDLTAEKENLEIEKEELLEKVKNLRESLDVLADAKELVTECHRLENELGIIKEENTSLRASKEKCSSMQVKLDEVEMNLAVITEESVKKEQELTDRVLKNEEIIEKLKNEKEQVIREFTVDLELKDKTVNSLQLQHQSFQSKIEDLNQLLDKKKEEEHSLKGSLQKKEAELEEIMSLHTKKEALEQEIKSLNAKFEKETESLTGQIEELRRDFETESKLKLETEKQKMELENLLSTRESEIEDILCAKEKLKEDLDEAKNSLLRHQEKAEIFLDEREKLTTKLNDLEKDISNLMDEKNSLTANLDEMKQENTAIRDTEHILRAQVDEAKEAFSEVDKLRSDNHQELLSCQEELQATKDSLQEVKKEHSLLKDKVKEKEEVIFSLGAKIESLDRKLTMAEEELEEKKRIFQQDLNLAKIKCDMLEKEVRAVREARTEEMNQYTTQVYEQEEQLRLKDTEVSTLQQEIKKLLQLSMSSSLCSVSQNTTADTSSVKRETNESDNNILALREEIRQKDLTNNSLLKEVSDLRGQLENLSLSHSAQMSKKKEQRKQPTSQSEIVTSDVESVCALTPVPVTRSGRKTRTPALPAVEINSIHLDSTTKDAMPQIKNNSASKRGKTTAHPQRSSQRIKKLDFLDCKDYDDDDDVWEPPKATKGKSGGTRKAKSRKTKVSEVFNPHLDQENNSLLV
ncbi:hypothetical protein SK128_027827 [Halocaridina rubra]|uniref:Kinesin motor domain-containing protein n=1 Tax=Halocaridina rubra TaxID=373956 RepID=A0AAN9A2H2_HALRR